MQGRLAKVEINEDGTGPVETTTEYEYNNSGARIKQTVTEDGSPSVVTEYHIDPNNPTGYAKAIEEFVDGTLNKSYVLGHAILSQTLDSDEVHHFLLDGHNSTRALLDDQSAVIETYAYDAFGKTLARTGLTAADDAQTTWLYGGDGQYDQATQLTNHLEQLTFYYG